jgi:hypothetical protein
MKGVLVFVSPAFWGSLEAVVCLNRNGLMRNEASQPEV